MDALTSILRSLSLESAILSRGRCTAPWGLRSRGDVAGVVHAVVRGECWIVCEAAPEPIHLREGDVVILPHGAAHTMCDHPATPPALRATVPLDRSRRVPLIQYGGSGPEVRLVCGTFHMEHAAARGFLEMLPPVLHVPAGPGVVDVWIRTTLTLLDQELDGDSPGADVIATRLIDILFIEALRRHVSGADAPRKGWLAATRDEHIGQALALMHTEPAARWSAERLAVRVAMSRTTFFDRFTELVGESPGRYLARWRVSTAADLIQRQDLSTAQVAELVGYASEDAFTRVFRRYVGVSPSEHRRRVRRAQAVPPGTAAPIGRAG